MYESMDDEDVHVVRQLWAPCTFLFTAVQAAVMAAMFFTCGFAPFNQNPMIGPYPDDLKEWGAKDTESIVKEGEWWRLLSPIFLHAGLIHLFCNLSVQIQAGALFEKEWGSARWVMIYLASGLLGNVGSVAFMPGEKVSVGCSGALMGLFGGKAAEVILRACESVSTRLESNAMDMRKAHCGAISWTLLVVLLSSLLPFVDWAAHLFGFLGGLVLGVAAFACDIKGYAVGRVIWLAIGVAATVVTYSTAIAYVYAGDHK